MTSFRCSILIGFPWSSGGPPSRPRPNLTTAQACSKDLFSRRRDLRRPQHKASSEKERQSFRPRCRAGLRERNLPATSMEAGGNVQPMHMSYTKQSGVLETLGRESDREPNRCPYTDDLSVSWLGWIQVNFRPLARSSQRVWPGNLSGRPMLHLSRRPRSTSSTAMSFESSEIPVAIEMPSSSMLCNVGSMDTVQRFLPEPTPFSAARLSIRLGALSMAL